MSTSVQEVESVRDWLASFGTDETGGMTRLLFTPEWLDAQLALKQKFEDMGMVAEFDEVGNLVGTYPGTDGTDDVIACGSHVDTVVHGGKLDGALGIFGGYLAIKDLVETHGAPRSPFASSLWPRKRAAASPSSSGAARTWSAPFPSPRSKALPITTALPLPRP